MNLSYLKIERHRAEAARANRKRHPDYFALKNKINQCTRFDHLDRLRQVIVGTYELMKHTQWQDDGNDLLVLFVQKEEEITDLVDIRLHRLVESRKLMKSINPN